MINSLSKLIRRWGALFLISSLSLFIELAVIRWLSGEIRIFSYFQNLALFSAFMGLSIGFALVGKGRDFRFSFPALWGFFALLVISIGTADRSRPLFSPSGNEEFLWYTSSAPLWLSLPIFLGLLIVFFLTTMFLFIPLGQATGEEMSPHPPIKAYIVNLLASLVGIWSFSVLSFLRTPPMVWFAIAIIGIGFYYSYLHKLARSHWIIFFLTLAGIAIAGVGKIWSPYNRLNLIDFSYTSRVNGETFHLGKILNVQQMFYQSAVDLSIIKRAELKENGDDSIADELEQVAKQYNLPYLFVPPQSRVLVVGAGMGNDVSAALRSDMGHVDAVEIDPSILELGRKFHPENPYADPRVLAITDDARAFLNKSDQAYDLVVFGLLDSHTLLSSMTSVRLDSYVYTLNSFERVKTHLNPGGFVVITFAANEWIRERLGRMLIQVFGADNVYIYIGDQTGTSFIAGEMTEALVSNEYVTKWEPDPAYDGIPLPTDDWPYLYLRDRQIPSGYWWALLLIGLVALFVITRSFPEALHPDAHFWLLGAAFLLVEFKSITELALLFGTTWFVNSLAISGILIMALFANLLVLKMKHINLGWAYGLLFTSLAFSFFFPLEWLAGFPDLTKAVLSTLLLSLPLFFAGLIFSESLRRAGETSRPLASNFSGSAVGGLLEYSSSFWGIKSLYIIAVLLYAGAMVAAFRKRGRN
jgi:hypothetical protein